MVLDTSLPCARVATTTEIPETNTLDHPQTRVQSQRSSSHRCSSRLISRGRRSCHSISCSPSINHPYSQRSMHHPSRRSSTPYRNQVSHFSIIKSKSNHKEGKLVTDTASDGHTSFHTTLKIINSQGSKSLPIKVDLGTDVYMISLRMYCKLFF